MFVDGGKVPFLPGGRVGGRLHGHIIDHGTEPDQKQAYFTLRDINGRSGGVGPRRRRGAIYAGLGDSSTRRWPRVAAR